MTKEQHRQTAAYTLLSIILSMILFTSLHVHESHGTAQNECYQCVNHMPHPGHFSMTTHGIHDCLLCQLISVPFLIATVATIAAVYSLGTSRQFFYSSFSPLSADGTAQLRAPPFLS